MNVIKNKIKNLLYQFLIHLISFYQKIVSPLLPARCRYYPTCSAYGKQALEWHGVYAGSWLLVKRLGRCQPFGGHGIDFVPLPLASYTYQYCPAEVEDQIKYPSDDFLLIPIYQGSYIYQDNHSYVARLNHLLK